MKTIAFFNSKGGVGRTTLVYHLAHMLPRLGYPTLAVDLDPQANLTTAFFPEDQIQQIWTSRQGSVMSAIAPLLLGSGDVGPVTPLEVADNLHVVAGSLELGSFEELLASDWPKTLTLDERALRETTAFRRLIGDAAQATRAAVCLVDLGPSLGAINHSALINSDHFLLPLVADLFSLPGLKHLGPVLREWRRRWKWVLDRNQSRQVASLPAGTIEPLGYVILERPAWRAGAKWIDEIPRAYRKEILGQEQAPMSPDDDPSCLATLHGYRSLTPMAQEARKPMFDLKAADGAIGSHATLVERCRREYQALAERIAAAAGLGHSAQP